MLLTESETKSLELDLGITKEIIANIKQMYEKFPGLIRLSEQMDISEEADAEVYSLRLSIDRTIQELEKQVVGMEDTLEKAK